MSSPEHKQKIWKMIKDIKVGMPATPNTHWPLKHTDTDRTPHPGKPRWSLIPGATVAP